MNEQDLQTHITTDESAASAPEVLVFVDKEVACETEKETSASSDPEVARIEALPEAVDQECCKEIAYQSSLLSIPKERTRWLKRHKRMLVAIVTIALVAAVTMGLGVGLGVKLQQSRSEGSQDSSTS